MSQPAGTGNTAPGVTTVAVLLLIWALFTYAIRAWVKLRKSDTWGVDDTAISISLLLAFFHVFATCYAVTHGYGNSWSDLSSNDNVVVKKSLYAAQILYVSSIGLTKASISLFNTRLTRHETNVRFSYGVTGLCAAWTIASIFTLAVRGDTSRPWDTVDGSRAMFVRWLGIEIAGCVIEFSLWAVSIYFIWNLHMPLSKRLSVGTIFACRLVLIPIVAVRLWHLSPSKNPETNRPAIMASIFTEIALEAAFMLSNITCLKPFLRPFHSGYFVSTVDAKSSGYKNTKDSSSRGDTYYMISRARSTNGNKDDVAAHGALESMSQDNQSDIEGSARGPAFRPDHTSHRATVLSGSGELVPRIDREGSEDMIISKTQAWTVSYEDDQRKSPAEPVP